MNQEWQAAVDILKENQCQGPHVTKQAVSDLITAFGGEERLKDVLSRTDNYDTPEQWTAAAIVALGVVAHRDESS